MRENMLNIKSNVYWFFEKRGFHFRCHPGWTGQNCSECIKAPRCTNGICTRPYECICNEGYNGTFCERPVCSEGCHPLFGWCDTPGQCMCIRGYMGSQCTECLAHPMCQYGFCIDPWDCICLPGFTGLYCDTRIRDVQPEESTAEGSVEMTTTIPSEETIFAATGMREIPTTTTIAEETP